MGNNGQTIHEHIEELRYRVLVSCCFFVLFSLLSYFFYDTLLKFLLRPLQHPLIFLAPQDAFILQIKISLFFGFLLTFPIGVYHLYKFIIKGMDKKYRLINICMLLSIILFIFSILFYYFFFLPVTLKFLLSFSNEVLKPQISAERYFSFVMGLMTAFIVIFQFPILVFAFGKIGILSIENLKMQRSLVLVIVLIIAAIVTPTADGFTMLVLAVPMYLLYELSIIFLKIL